MSEKEKSVPFTDAQKILMEAPADDWFTRCKKDFFLRVGRDMVCSEHQELHKRLLSLDPQDWHELNAVKAIFNNGQWLDKDATEAMIILLTTMYNNPHTITNKTQKEVQNESFGSLIALSIGIFIAIPLLCCLNRDLMILFGALYVAAFPVMLAMHAGGAFFLALMFHARFFDEAISEKHKFDCDAWSDKLIFEKQYGIKFKENVCKNILYPFFDIENYIAKNQENFFYKDISIKQIEDKRFRKKLKEDVKHGVVIILIIIALCLLGMYRAGKNLFLY